MDSARLAKNSIDSDGKLSRVIEILQERSKFYDCDFIVVSHQEGAELLKIRDGKVSDSQDYHWIGDSNLVKLLEYHSEILDESIGNVLRLNPISQDYRNSESNFLITFIHFFGKSAKISNDVGGLATSLLGSPYGHCYQMHAGVYMPGPMALREGPPHPDTPPQGGDRYAYHFLAPDYRGVGIAGAFFEQANLGFIYNPLEWDQPKRVRNTTRQAVQEEINLLAAMSGGKPESDQ